MSLTWLGMALNVESFEKCSIIHFLFSLTSHVDDLLTISRGNLLRNGSFMKHEIRHHVSSHSKLLSIPTRCGLIAIDV